METKGQPENQTERLSRATTSARNDMEKGCDQELKFWF